MKQLLSAVFTLLITVSGFAQPSKQQVVTRLTHNGVIKVEVVKIEKVWERGKYVWVAHATVTKAVPPETVDGLKGVTLLIATSAYYDLGAAQPYQVLGSESNGEYRGINLPLPTNDDLQKWGTEFGKNNPEKFFMQGNSILGIEQVIVTKPNCVWLHPRKLQFEAGALYVEKLTKETIQKVQSRCVIELHRNGLKEPWYLGKAEMMTNESRYIGNIIHVSDAPQWDNAPTLTERKMVAESNAALHKMGIEKPPVFTSGTQLALHVISKLHTLDKEKMVLYLGQLLRSDLKVPGGALNGNGTEMVERAVENAYTGWGKFKDQYCIVPARIELLGTRVAFYNKEGSRYSYIHATSENGSYFIEKIDIAKEKTKEENARFAAMPCSDGSTTSTKTAATIQQPAGNATFAKGDKVQVEENGKWYPATVLEVKPNEWFIHYDGYSAKYDLWVGPDRIKK